MNTVRQVAVVDGRVSGDERAGDGDLSAGFGVGEGFAAAVAAAGGGAVAVDGVGEGVNEADVLGVGVKGVRVGGRGEWGAEEKVDCVGDPVEGEAVVGDVDDYVFVEVGLAEGAG